MANDLGSTVLDALGHAVRDALKNAGDAAPSPKKNGPLSGARGIAAGAGLAAAAPLAKKGYDQFRGGSLPGGGVTGKAGGVAGKAASKAGERVGSKLKDAVGEKVDEAGGAGGLVKDAASGLLPGGGDDSGGKGGMPGVGKGRRMPVQQSVDVAVPLETAYNQWTQFEDWPEFMHRVKNVTQDDDCTVKFNTKIWGKTKEFEANIETQRPDERIKWRVSQGITHTGVVTFHELAPRLTRIELSMDVDPGSLIEKAARGMRHIKRAIRADLHRFKAFIEMQELETGAWRGVIEDGELVEPHDESYDEERDYSDVDDLYDMQPGDDDDADDAEGDEEEESDGNGNGHGRSDRFKRQAERATSRATSARSSSRSTGGSGSRSSGSGSSGSRSSGSGSSGTKKAPAKRAPAKRSQPKSSQAKSSQAKSSPAKRSSSASSAKAKSGGGSNGKSASGSTRASGRSRSGSGTSNGRTSGSRRKSTSKS